jgi:hypothetical protein
VHVKVVLAAALALIAVAVAVTLSHAPARTIAAQSVPPEKTLVSGSGNASACQSGEVLPRGTSAIRIGLFQVSGSGVEVKVLAGHRLITRGTLAAGWSGEGATVPVGTVARTVSPVTVCFYLRSALGTTQLLGRPTPPAEAAVGEGKPLPGKMSVEYLRPGPSSWWSLAGSVARRLGLGRAGSGLWNAFLVMALAATVVALSTWMLVRDLR